MLDIDFVPCLVIVICCLFLYYYMALSCLVSWCICFIVFTQFLLMCAEQLPHKIPLYGTLVEISSLSLSLLNCNGIWYLFSCMLQYLSLILDAYACTKVTQIWHVLLFISIVIVVIFGCVVSLCSFFIGSFIWWTCKIAVLGELNLLLLCLWQWKCYSVLWPVSKIGLLVISHDNVSDQPYF